MMFAFVRSFIFFGFAIVTVNIYAQQTNDTVVYNNALINVKKLFAGNQLSNSQLYYGTEYAVTGHNIKGSPYFQSDSFKNSVIGINNLTYNDVQAIYDLVQDEIIIKNYFGNKLIVLPFSSVDSAIISGSVLIPFNNNNLKPGFYQRLYKDSSRAVYAKKEKIINNYIKDGSPESAYIEYDSYFLEEKNIFYKIKDEDDFLNFTKNKKSQVKKYIKTERLNFKKDFENALVKSVEYYSDLK